MAPIFATWVYSILPERGIVIAAGLAASILIYHAATTFFAWRRLSHFPGPPLASVSNLWSFFAVYGGRCNTTFSGAQKKYGKAMRIGPDSIMVYDPETLWQVNSVRSTYNRGGWYESVKFNPDGENVFSELNTDLHDERKTKLITGFNGKGSMNLEADIDSQIAGLVRYIHSKILDREGAQIDFSKIMRWFQLDLITLIGMGKAWEDLANETDHFNFLGGLDSAIPLLHAATLIPFLRKILFSNLYLYLFAPKVTDKEGMGRSIREMKSIVKSRFENTEAKQGREHGDMLEEWMKHDLDPEQSLLDLGLLMPAGTETTITAIRSILLHILTSPTAYYKLKEEISDGIKAGRISKPITNEQAKDMPYLQAIIIEGIRLVPPLVNGFAKQVPPGGDTICGKFVPEGVEIHCNFVTMLRNTEVFGADAEVFRPERFLDCDAELRVYRQRVVDLAFGHGRWLCLGKTLAMIELNKIFVELLRVFDFQIANAEQPWKRTVYSTSIVKDFDLRIWENRLD